MHFPALSCVPKLDLQFKVAATTTAVQLQNALKLIDIASLCDRNKRILLNLCKSWCQCVLTSRMALGPLLGFAMQKGTPLTRKSVVGKTGAMVHFVIPSVGSAAGAFYEEVGDAAHNVIRQICVEHKVS